MTQTHNEALDEYVSKAAKFAAKVHADVNHLYDNYLPYEFHLRMAASTAAKFNYLLPNDKGTQSRVIAAVWCHDVLEDTRHTFNDLAAVIGNGAANIVYAVTNEKGKTRKERANAKYYKGIRNTPYAVFAKLCDRIANVTYGQMTQSRMVELYYKEQSEFITNLGEEAWGGGAYRDMVLYLRDIFENNP